MSEFIFGEAVGGQHFGLMEWVDLEKAIDRMGVETVLGRWMHPPHVGGENRIACCFQDDGGDFFALVDESEEGEPSRPEWRRVVDPDQVLVPVVSAGPALDGAARVVAEFFAERRRQIDEEGWVASHDDKHIDASIARAAACYALTGSLHDPRSRARVVDDAQLPFRMSLNLVRTLWPWGAEWFKPKSPRRDLVRAGALIVAEIERLDRDDARAERVAETAKK